MNAKKINCLNCCTKTIGKYCHNCTQKSDTKRLNLKHFISHDIIHGTLHLDKGLLFTLKEIIIRPGKVASNYINGQRVRYYNFFYLTLILIGLILFFKGYNNSSIINEVSDKPISKVSYNLGKELASNYFKHFLLSFIPLFAISSSIAYRKNKLNLAEHGIIAGVCLIYILLYTLVLQFVHLWFSTLDIRPYFFFVVILTIILVYIQAFKDYYPKRTLSNLFNSFLTVVVFSVLMVVLVSLVIATVMLFKES
ncbi:DUF3667 domain-containing protein [Chryseobacterium aquaticum]|jgi:hypothetical protein|uniref:DUF3667 domain-containing protein n=1 Tax=Chryseobacterium aquaticum TaxID=452084 RepID=UPI002FCA963A